MIERPIFCDLEIGNPKTVRIGITKMIASVTMLGRDLQTIVELAQIHATTRHHGIPKLFSGDANEAAQAITINATA